MRILFLLLLASNASARVFNFSDATVATFLSGQYGRSALQDAAYAHTSGNGNTFDQSVTTQVSGEVGVVIGSPTFNTILAVELLRPTLVADANGSTAGGTKLMTISSQINAVVASAGFEVLMFKGPTSRFLFGARGGYADVSVINGYTLNTQGKLLYPNVAPTHEERFNGFGFSSKAYFGFEFLFTANVTCSWDLGYRYLTASSFTYATKETTLKGDREVGAAVKDYQDKAVTLDLSGAYTALNLRFYFL